MHTPQITFPQEIPPFQSRIKNARVVLETSWYIMVANPKQMATIFSAGGGLTPKTVMTHIVFSFKRTICGLMGSFSKRVRGRGWVGGAVWPKKTLTR